METEDVRTQDTHGGGAYLTGREPSEWNPLRPVLMFQIEVDTVRTADPTLPTGGGTSGGPWIFPSQHWSS